MFKHRETPQDIATSAEATVEAPPSNAQTRELRNMSFTEQVQHLSPGPIQFSGGERAVQQAAAQGVSGSAQVLPHIGAIQQSFGSHDVTTVQAHVGGAAQSANQSMGSEAYATGNSVAFKGAPTLHTAAHEAAHIVQQRAGVSLKGGVGAAGDSYEQHADRVADCVVQGKSAESLLDSFAGKASQVQHKNGPVQYYQGIAAGTDVDGAGGSFQTDVRVSDDAKMAVAQESSIGGQTAYATTGLIQDAATKLQAATSSIALKPGGLSETFKKPGGGTETLVDVVPVNTKNNTEDLDMKLWADCGRSAKTVSGMDGGSGRGNVSPSASYDKEGQTKATSNDQWMEIQKVEMFVDLFNVSTGKSWWQFWKPKYETKLDITTINAKLTEYKALREAKFREPNKAKQKQIARQMAILAKELDVLARAEYEKLGQDAKDDFDEKAGINIYADPEIGEAFHMSSGGDAHPGLVKHNQDLRADQAQGDRLDEDPMGTWNFHWAGVVMKSAGDTMTLENYSVSKYNVENKEWAFQLYGVGKKGQSFQDEHKDKHMQHGDAPTTMTAQRPKP